MSVNNKKEISGTPAFVSVIMPVHNEAGFIERSLKAVLEQNYPKQRMEVIIADGMSTDKTRALIEQLKEKTEVPIIVVDNIKQIAPSGLNCALEKARGEIIIRVDGHCEIDKDYIANCVRHLQSQQAVGVGGPIETIGETFLANVIAIAMSSSFGVGGSAFRTIKNRQMYVDTVAFPGYTRQIIREAGDFNEELIRNQDDEYNFRIRKLGGKIMLCPDIRSRYYSRSSLKSLWRQYFQYGYWKVRVLQLHPLQMSFRQFVPFIFVLSLITMTLLSIFSSLAGAGLLVILGSYLAANLIASLMISMKNSLSIFPLLSLSFMILHISYGLGFLVGLISFRKHWRKAYTEPKSESVGKL